MNWLAAVGLVLDIVGVMLLFQFAPEKHPDPQTRAFFALEGEDAVKREKWKRLQPVRVRMSKLSLVLIVTGFVLQLIAEVWPT